VSTRSLLAPLLATAVIGPLAVLVLFGVGRLLAAMGDQPGGDFIWRLAWIGIALLVVDVFALVILLAADSILRDRRPPDEPPP